MTVSVTVHHPIHFRFLPGEEGFVLWYGLVTDELTMSSPVGDLFQATRTKDGREWMLRRPVRKEDVERVKLYMDVERARQCMDDVPPSSWNREAFFSHVDNPWCPDCMKRAWVECARRRWEQHNGKGDAE